MMPELPQRMKRHIILILCMALLALPAACSPSDGKAISDGEDMPKPVLPSPAGGSSGQVEFELATDFPSVPDTVKIYKVVHPHVTAESVTELGRKLGFTGEAHPAIDNEILMSDKKTGASLEVFRNSGGFVCRFKRAKTSELYLNPPSLPSYEEAAKIATDFLTQR